MGKIKAIYGIKDKRNDKVIYIGQTKDFEQRKRTHISGKISPIDKYMFDEGRDNFLMYILEELTDDIDRESMKIKEQEYIEKINTIKNGLNKRVSGSKEFQKEYRKEYHKEYEKTEKCKEYRKSKKYKESHKEYMKEYQKTEKWKEYHKEYMRKYYQKQKEKNI